MSQMPFDQTIGTYYEECGENGRYRSWDHCYNFFQKHHENLLDVLDCAALQLGFYLASWGMYRGSTVIRNYDYTIHRPVICVLASSDFKDLWQRDVGAHDNDIGLVATIMKLVKLVGAEYRRLGQKNTDILVTKVLLGTVCCLPARDDYFRKGCSKGGFTFGSLNEDFVKRILEFCKEYRQELSEIQRDKLDLYGHPYPFMKLVDMHFFQLGKG